MKSEVIIRDYGLENAKYKYHSKNLPQEAEVEICKSWLQKFAVKKNVKKDECIFSYGLKHVIENSTNQYVSNGACILAAKELGYKFWAEENSVNAYFHMQLRLPEDEWKRIRPRAFSEWLFGKTQFALATDAQKDPNWPRDKVRFIDFWQYLNGKGDWVLEEFYTLWEMWSGNPAPRPELINTEIIYNQECDVISYGDEYPKAEPGKIYLYALFEENESESFNRVRVRYVGQTNDPSRRLIDHTLRPGTIDRVKWVGSLLLNGKAPKMAIFSTVSSSEANNWEMAAIIAFSESENYWDDEANHFPPLEKALLNRRYI
ncbi:MAG: hypothetical protein H6667_10805 [Ardenticatenaceae bacterium]|nr:hypothetical protein [Ardenticatenaceae bacterium]MCB9444407.1 hypothetical protein [Ardenticatenaceae bacterium]